ncbi:MAG TPA: class I adenylate-forming enzyme family protein [Pseudonocardiaceae bacterium]|nr:class I adenylate-forming enzyme family protein [Pseudonocardiaceae bacterium]
MTVNEQSIGTAAPAVAVGPPLDLLVDLITGPRIDAMPHRAAQQAPDRYALRGPGGALTYRELDERVDHFAAALWYLLGRSGVVVAVASVLDPVFAVAYYGVARAGDVSVVANPLLPIPALEYALRASDAELAVVPPQAFGALAAVRDRLPALRHVVVTDRGDGVPADVPTVAELVAMGATLPAAPESPAGQHSVASILFTSGTTGAPKAVPLTHRNLIVNAAQTAYAQELTGSSVLLNYLPTFHTMHLNAAMCAVATQVLYVGGDVVGSIAAANEHGVTHYYSLPMRLAMLAAQPELGSLRLTTVTALLSGGSALPPATAATLCTALRRPVVQGYGLAEASPLTHFNSPDEPRAGSCGLPVAGTESRIVDIADRSVLAAGEVGELQVRGPQVMSGYLGTSTTDELDDAGWLSTGDVARMDADGYLYLVDRLKDVFKVDNFLVSPTELEAVVRQHPSVADCVVVDQPDPIHGALAAALLVLRDGGAADAVVEFVNDRVPYYMRLHRVLAVESIPRSRNGKVQRRELRTQLPATDH